MARRDTALLVTPTWKIDMARRDPALLVMPKWKIDVARGAVALLFTSGYRHGKEGHSPPCHAETGCRWGWGLPGCSEIELRRSILWMVGVGAAYGNQPAPKLSLDTRFCGWWSRLQVIVIGTIKYLKNGVRTLYARPLPISRGPLPTVVPQGCRHIHVG